MYPPGYLPYGPTGDTGSNSNHPGTSSPSPGALASRLSNFGGASPSQSNAPNFPAALPKFGQAFGKKSHFDVIPGLGSLSSPPAGSLTTNPTLPTINSMQDTNLQVINPCFDLNVKSSDIGRMEINLHLMEFSRSAGLLVAIIMVTTVAGSRVKLTIHRMKDWDRNCIRCSSRP